MKRLVLLAALPLSLFGCAYQDTQRVVVDPQGVDMARYQRDLADCEYLADNNGTGQKVATGAVAGAVVGALLGAATGNHETAAKAAGVGAIVGGAGMAGQGVQDKDMIVKNCMRGRGYRVLN